MRVWRGLRAMFILTGGIVGYSIASGEITQIGATATSDGITEASTIDIGGKTLHEVAYNEALGTSIKAGERVALLLTPTGFVAALRRAGGETVYASDEGRAYLEKPLSYAYYGFFWLLGLLTTFAGIGLVILIWATKSYLKRKDIAETMAGFRQATV